MSLVFISYAREDIDAARRLAGDLKSRGVNTWFDEEQLLPGQRWKDEITKAVRSSDYFILLLSPHSVSKRGYIQHELRQALEIADERPGSVYVIPVRLQDDAAPPEGRLQELHWLDMFPSWEKGVERLLKAIRPEVTPIQAEASVIAVQSIPGEGKVGFSEVLEIGSPTILIAWDPEVLDEGEYIELATALGDLVRAEGGVGIERLNSEEIEVPSRVGVLA